MHGYNGHVRYPLFLPVKQKQKLPPNGWSNISSNMSNIKINYDEWQRECDIGRCVCVQVCALGKIRHFIFAKLRMKQKKRNGFLRIVDMVRNIWWVTFTTIAINHDQFRNDDNNEDTNVLVCPCALTYPHLVTPKLARWRTKYANADDIKAKDIRFAYRILQQENAVNGM